MPNPFQIIPAKVRVWLYLAYGTAGLAVSSVATYAIAVGDTVPKWAIGAAAVLTPIGTALGFVAASNTTQAATATVTAPADVELRTNAPDDADDFYEPDEDPKDVKAAFEAGPKNITSTTTSTQTYAGDSKRAATYGSDGYEDGTG